MTCIRPQSGNDNPYQTCVYINQWGKKIESKQKIFKMCDRIGKLCLTQALKRSNIVFEFIFIARHHNLNVQNFFYRKTIGVIE